MDTLYDQLTKLTQEHGYTSVLYAMVDIASHNAYTAESRGTAKESAMAWGAVANRVEKCRLKVRYTLDLAETTIMRHAYNRAYGIVVDARWAAYGEDQGDS